ncbi:MAG: hypothetical protein VB034_01190 [Eubacteriales bacterium]|nr:hypothetical protein [Eubacteriales bacterium]
MHGNILIGQFRFSGRRDGRITQALYHKSLAYRASFQKRRAKPAEHGRRAGGIVWEQTCSGDPAKFLRCNTAKRKRRAGRILQKKSRLTGTNEAEIKRSCKIQVKHQKIKHEQA